MQQEGPFANSEIRDLFDQKEDAARDSLISPRPCIVPGILAGKNTKNVVLDRKNDKQLGYSQNYC